MEAYKFIATESNVALFIRSGINLDWNWSTLTAFTVPITRLPSREGARYRFDVPDRYKKKLDTRIYNLNYGPYITPFFRGCC